MKVTGVARVNSIALDHIVIVNIILDCRHWGSAAIGVFFLFNLPPRGLHWFLFTMLLIDEKENCYNDDENEKR